MSPEKRKMYSELRLNWFANFEPPEDYYKEIAAKSKVTFEKNGTKPGRPKGPRPKSGQYKPCPICGIDVYHMPKELKENKRKCCSRECLSKDPVYISKCKNVDKSYMKTEKYRNSVTKTTDMSDYKRYTIIVRKLTEETYKKYKHMINPDNHNRSLAGTVDAYHLDHRISIYEGFHSNIAPEIIAHKDNLQMLPWRDNIVKGK